MTTKQTVPCAKEAHGNQIKHSDGKYYCPASTPWRSGVTGLDQRTHAPGKKLLEFSCMQTQKCANEFNKAWNGPGTGKFERVKMHLPPPGVLPITPSAWELFKKRADPVAITLALILFAIAFYMSWSCSGSTRVVEKLAYATLSGFFGLFYIPYALLFKSKTCTWI